MTDRDPTGKRRRTELQRGSDSADCDLYRVICRIEALADRIKVAGPKLRGVANKLHAARGDLRSFMHSDDREATRGY